MITRRRFIAVSAAALAAGPARASSSWRGIALGADASITIEGPPAATQAALDGAVRLVRQVEAAFSLFDEGSELSRLNRAGRIAPSAMFADLVAQVGPVHAATGGLFDPTVQPLWQALAEGRDPGPARALIGWERVGTAGPVVLQPGQALTFNGIAQGFATDLVADHLRAAGFGQILVDIGEYAGFGRDWRLGLADPVQGFLGQRTIRDGAIATSSPQALPLPGGGHILNPQGGPPRWSTVAVEATRATLADGLSTAICLMERADIPALRERLPGLGRITLVDFDGNLSTV